MHVPAELVGLEGISLRLAAPMADYTRFGIGGPADLLIEAQGEQELVQALNALRRADLPLEIIGDGTNLVVSDEGFRGAILRYRANRIELSGSEVRVDAGATLQSLVDTSIDAGLAGIHTMTGIPGSVGAAIYGNAGAYGRSISESVLSVRYFDGYEIRETSRAGCEFEYRESIFKRRKEWVILCALLGLEPGDAGELRAAATRIRTIRDEKYPPSMKCAGSIFKNLIYAKLPEPARSAVPASVVREGKVPSAWFLEQAGVKGMSDGGIVVADYHANLIYNRGGGTAAQLRRIIEGCKEKVRLRFALELEEEVQYIGF